MRNKIDSQKYHIITLKIILSKIVLQNCQTHIISQNTFTCIQITKRPSILATFMYVCIHRGSYIVKYKD